MKEHEYMAKTADARIATAVAKANVQALAKELDTMDEQQQFIRLWQLGSDLKWKLENFRCPPQWLNACLLSSAAVSSIGAIHPGLRSGPTVRGNAMIATDAKIMEIAETLGQSGYEFSVEEVAEKINGDRNVHISPVLIGQALTRLGYRYVRRLQDGTRKTVWFKQKEQDMSAKQWGHGFHAGQDAGFGEGYNEGYQNGLACPDMMLAEQINVLLIDLHRCMGEESIQRWVVWNAISKLNSAALINDQRAAHKVCGK